jgi:hypothetical protein
LSRIAQINLTYIPEYSDGAATVKFKSVDQKLTTSVDLKFRITPESVASKLKEKDANGNELWQSMLRMEAVYTNIRSRANVGDTQSMVITNYTYNEVTKVATISASCGNLDDAFFNESMGANISLSIDYFSNSFSTAYIPLMPLAGTVESNKYQIIYFTKSNTDGQIVEPNEGYNFGEGVEIISNVYKDGMGIITLNKEMSFFRVDDTIGVFSGKEDLQSIVLPEGNYAIGRNAFKNSGLAGELILPEGITQIGVSAFENCDKLSDKLYIPNSVTTIHEKAFYDCNGFVKAELHLGANVKTLGKNAFTILNANAYYQNSFDHIYWHYANTDNQLSIVNGSVTKFLGAIVSISNSSFGSVTIANIINKPTLHVPASGKSNYSKNEVLKSIFSITNL